MSFHPQTPQSPSHFSPATSTETAPSLSTSASIVSSTPTLPTPAHSVNGSTSQLDVAMSDESPQKRKRPLEDSGDREQKKVHLEDRKLGIEDLHRDVGPKYLLCQTPLPKYLPRTSEDLFDLYGLSGLATELAREKPNGEKNALRKTYKGHIKRLGVAGHFDVSKKQDGAPSDFLSMLQVPDLEWDVHQVKGKDISDGLSEITLSTIGRSMTMAKGPIAKSVWDTSVLGELAPSTTDPSKQPSSAKATAPNTPSANATGGSNRPKGQGPPGQDPARPKRSVKKRTYGDSSFEGYGEGFVDDDGGETGYSTGEGEGGQKRRKKGANSPPFPSAMRQQSYGPGMVGA